MIIEYSPAYYQQALDMGRKMHQESRYRDYAFDEAQIMRIISNPDCLTLLSVRDEQVVGFFVGVITPQWFGPDLTGQDLGLYIDQPYRGGTMAMRFMKRFEAWCRGRGCRSIQLGSTAGIDTEVAYRLYTGMGYRDLGFLAYKEL